MQGGAIKPSITIPAQVTGHVVAEEAGGWLVEYHTAELRGLREVVPSGITKIKRGDDVIVKDATLPERRIVVAHDGERGWKALAAVEAVVEMLNEAMPDGIRATVDDVLDDPSGLREGMERMKCDLETLRAALIDIGQAVGLPGGRADMISREVASLAYFAAEVTRAMELEDANFDVLANKVAVNAGTLKRVREMLGVTSTRTDDLVAAISRLQAPSVEVCDLRDAMARIRNAVGLGPNAGRDVTADEVAALARFHHTACVCLGLDAGKPPSETMGRLADALDAYVRAELDPPGVPERPSPFVLVGAPASGLESIDVRTVTRAWSQRGSHGVWLGTAVPQSVPAAYIERPCGTLVLCCDTDEEAAAIVERIHAARVACCR